MSATLRIGFLSVVLLAVLVPGLRAEEDPALLAGQVRTLLRDRCLSCHSGEGSRSGYSFDVLRDETLKAKLGDEDPVVTPGKPDDSLLYAYVKTDRMPQGKEKLNADEKERIRKWIQAGATPFPLAIDRGFISLKQLLTAVRDDLRSADAKDRPYLRYFTLTHLYNNKRVPAEDLPLYRAALSKAINSLSWGNRIVVPQPVKGSLDTAYVIDIRTLGWDRDFWNEVLGAYPYGLRYGDHEDKELRKLDEEIYDYTKVGGVGCPEPMVRGDWFTATATRPPLYHTLLFDDFLPALKARPRDDKAAEQGNPKRMTAKDLEDYLGVDVRKNFLSPTPEQIARAGFTKSGVSGQNRMVERNAARYGAYWKSYDFKAENGRSKLARLPLGPLNLFPKGKHPFADQAFAQDGGEIIFNLPNGLQGYLLVNGKDERIDEGPIQVVGDDTRTSGTPAIVAGVSCMNCHAHGMLECKDQIRRGNAVFGKARDKVEDLYPAPEKMDQFLAEDRERFDKAAEKATKDFFKGEKADGGKPARDAKEPIGKVAQRYRLEYLDLQDVAAELYLEKPEDLRSQVGADAFKELGLDALLQKGGVVGRLEWEALDGTSLMQRVAQKLGATPVVPVR